MSSPSESKHSMQLRSRGNMSKERSSEESEDSSSSAEFEEEIIPSPKKNQESTKPKDEELTEEFEDEELIEESEGEQPLEEKQESESNQNVTKALNVTQQNNHEKDSKKTLYTALLIIASLVIGIGMKSSCFGTPEPSVDIDWRSKIDPKNHLSNEDQSMIRASLKPILDKSSSRQDESISTLLILSPNENTAAQIAQCLLALVNRQTNANQKSAEIDLRSYSGNKSNLDSELRSILDSTNPAKAVLLRGINHIPFEHLLERLRLLFGYCDGENPVITNRLFFLTANSTSENNLREYFKNKLPTEHDFVDALMARISGHTIYIESDQKSIC